MSWSRSPGTPWTVDGETVWVLNVEAGEAYGLQAVAGLIWEQVDGTQDVDDLVDRLVEEHGWVAQDIRSHVVIFMAELVARGLVQETL